MGPWPRLRRTNAEIAREAGLEVLADRLLADPTQVHGFRLENIVLDGNGQASECIRGRVERGVFKNLHLTGAGAYSFHLQLRDSDLEDITVEHVAPLQGTDSATHTLYEDVWSPAGASLVAGGTVGIDNNGMDFGADNTSGRRIRVNMRGNDTQSGFWQNGSDNTTWEDVQVIDGLSGIGGEQVDDLTFDQPKCTISGAAFPGAAWNARIGWFQGSAGQSTNIQVRNPSINSSVSDGIAYSANCSGSIIGGRISCNNDDAVVTNGSNNLAVVGADVSGSNNGIETTTGSFGSGVEVRGCIGMDDLNTNVGAFRHEHTFKGQIGAGDWRTLVEDAASNTLWGVDAYFQGNGAFLSALARRWNGAGAGVTYLVGPITSQLEVQWVDGDLRLVNVSASALFVNVVAYRSMG